MLLKPGALRHLLFNRSYSKSLPSLGIPVSSFLSQLLILDNSKSRKDFVRQALLLLYPFRGVYKVCLQERVGEMEHKWVWSVLDSGLSFVSERGFSISLFPYGILFSCRVLLVPHSPLDRCKSILPSIHKTKSFGVTKNNFLKFTHFLGFDL